MALNALPGNAMTLFAVETPSSQDSAALQAGCRLAGSLTDGDIRRALIAGVPLDGPVTEAMHRDCIRLSPGCDRYQTVACARKRAISLLPETDSRGYVTSILDLSSIKAALPLDAVLMAGGKGERLRPLTADTPKPLLKVGRKAIIDYNVDELLSCGLDRIYVTVNYLKDQLIEHFAAPAYRGKVVCVEEPCRLGTIGSLALVPGLRQQNLVLMNSDLLTDMDFEAMYRHHIESKADITMGAVPYTVSVPFSILDTKGTEVRGLTEKPTFNYFAGAGVYMMKTSLVAEIPKGEYLDAPDFVERVIARAGKVSFFPIEGTWIDIGSPDDYRYACEAMNLRH